MAVGGRRSQTVRAGKVMDATSSNGLNPAVNLRRVRTALIVARFEGAAQADIVLAPLWDELAAVLQLSDDERATVRRAGRRLLESARRPWPTREANILFGLQTLVLSEHQDDPYDYVEWLRSFGRVSYRRSRPLKRKVEKFRRLAEISDRLRRVARTDEEVKLAELLEPHRDRVRDEAFVEIREHLEVVLDGIDMDGTVDAKQQIVAALLGRIERWGGTDFLDVRDAVARCDLKMHDLRAAELVGEDALLEVDAAIARRLDGVHHRAEVYLRLLHRLQSVLFGTSVGRLLSQYLLGPLAVSAILLFFVEYIAEQFFAEPAVATLVNVSGLAVLLSLMVNVGPIRRAIVDVARGIGGWFSRRRAQSAAGTSWLGRAWRSLRALYAEVVESVITSLYVIDDQLRFPSPRPPSARIADGWLRLGLFFVTYVVRFAFRLVIEPTVNPVKHIPVVTVAGKISIASGLPVFLVQSLGTTMPAAAAWTLGTTISIIALPGLIGFLAWETRYNWRLYRANGPRKV